MRKPDLEVREVVCADTGKPIVKIPLWMADIKVKFVSEEARQKHPSASGLSDLEVLRNLSASSELAALKEVDPLGIVLEDEEGFEGDEEDPDEVVEENLEV